MKSYIGFCLPSRVPSWRHRLVRSTLFALCALGVALLDSRAQTITSAVPGFISYQGKFTNASGVAVGAGAPVNRLVIFRVWSHQSNSTVNDLLYSEQQTVAISEGEFSVLIGAGTAVAGTPLGYSETAKGPSNVTIASVGVFGGATRYLGVTVDDGSALADPELSPRQQIVSSAYALRSKYAESVGANGASTIVALDNGNVGIGAANPGAKLEVAGSIRAGGAGIANPAISLLANSASAIALTAGYANVAGNFSSDAVAGDTVLRTDNGGKLLLQSGTGGSALTINGSNQVGIGQPNPGFPLNFASTLGDKISLYGNAGGHYGFGVQGSLLQIHGDLSTTDIGFGHGASGSFTELMRIKGTGNVGIGTTTPGAKLEVNGSVRANGASGFTFGGSGDTDGGLFSPADGVVAVQTNSAERVRVNASGNVGIGNTAPIAPLSFASTIGQKITLWGSSTTSNFGLGIQNSVLQFHTDVSASDIVFGYGSSGSFTETMRVKGNGRVGIGTNSPIAPLQVAGGAALGAFFLGARVAPEYTGDENNSAFNASSAGWGGTTHSIVSDLRIRASALDVTNINNSSDARIKRIVGRSSGSADLRTLMDIEVTDYTFIDQAVHGRAPQKKVIAQQLESVFPQAVTRAPGVIPDVYRKADLRDGWVILATDLRVGEHVRLIGETQSGVYEVLETRRDGFRTAFNPPGEQVFVYGREVNDFGAIDYVAVSMLNVSATQEIKREKDAEIAALRERVAELEAKDRARDARLASIEKLLQSSQTVMARPAAAPRSNANGQE